MATTRLTKAEQSQKTRRALLDTARVIFTTQGYAATATEEVVRRAGVTRGALYYHFRDKAALFEAVFDEVGQEYMAALRADIMSVEGDAWRRLMLGIERFLDRLLDPSVRAHYVYRRPGRAGLVVQRAAPGAGLRLVTGYL